MSYAISTAGKAKVDQSGPAYERLPDFQKNGMTLTQYRAWLCNKHSEGVWVPYMSTAHLVPDGKKPNHRRSTIARSKNTRTGYIMSTIHETLKRDSLEARKSGNKLVAQTLTTLISEIQGQGKTEEERLNPSNEVAIAVIKKFVKNLDETIRVSGPGLMSKNVLERDVLETYLPTQLTEDEIKTIIHGLKNTPAPIMEPTLGNIMGYFKEMYPGRYDGALVSKLAR